jgi:predicted SAM-dependent methyltransferase
MQQRHGTGQYGTYPGNYALSQRTLAQELRTVARPLKRGDVRGVLHAMACGPANLWNHYVRSRGPARFICSCCGRSAHAFVHLSDHRAVTWNAACPSCDSRSRHRGLALLIPRILGDRADLHRTLHFAPEGVLAGILKPLEQLEYQTTDLDDVGCDFPGEDIQSLSFADGQYDLVICNHVLEHVPDDGAAMAELCRILSAHGLAIITVPCDWQKAATKPAAHVDPGGHYRHYGRDLLDRLARSFGSVQVFDMHELDAASNDLRYGIRQGDMVFLCSKQQSGGFDMVEAAVSP